MKIQLLSDLHLEAHPHFVPEPAPGADVLVLAGDIGSYQEGGQLGDEDFGLARFSPLPQWGAWPTPVLFVPGTTNTTPRISTKPTSGCAVPATSWALPGWNAKPWC